MTKTLGTIQIEENFPILINGNYDKFINSMKINAFILRLRTRQECLLSQFLVNIVVEVTNQCNMVCARNKSIIDWKGEIILPSFLGDIIIYVEDT